MLALLYLLMSIRRIGPTEVGLVTKRFGWRRLSQDNPIAFDGEVGYQADLMMPGLRFKAFLVYSVDSRACGLSQTIVQLAIFRFILGLGMGG